MERCGAEVGGKEKEKQGAAMSILPDESRSLLPPNIVNRNSLVLGGIGWAAVVLSNLGYRRPPLGSGEGPASASPLPPLPRARVAA